MAGDDQFERCCGPESLTSCLEGLKEAHHARRLFIEAATEGIFWLNGAR